MLIPKIIFKYSWIYDKQWENVWLKSRKKKNIKKYPSPKVVFEYTKKIEKLWRKEERKILTEISKITRLKWQEKFIDCYVIGRHTPFSQPLTMQIYEKYDYFIDVLTHELIHNIFIQNEKSLGNCWKYFFEKYKKEPVNTQVHIYLHAFHKHIFLKFYSEKRLNREIKSMSRFPAYKRSWEIVQRDGYQNIINEFVKRIK
jgi:hypothetical protein